MTLADLSFAEMLSMAGFTARPVQCEFALAVEQALDLTGKISCLHADTGVGKSLGYLATSMKKAMTDPRRPRIIVATHSHALMAQLYEKDGLALKQIATAAGVIPPSIGRLLGRANFISPERVEQEVNGRTLSQNEEAQIATLLTWDKTIAEYIDNYDHLPCGLEAAQICRNAECSSEEFDASQLRELSCDIVITSHAMVAVDILHHNKVLGDDNRPTLLIVDEADALVGLLQEWSQRRVNLIQIAHKLGSHLSQRFMKKLDERIDTIREQLTGKHYAWNTEFNELARDTITLIGGLVNRLPSSQEKIDIEQQLSFIAGNRLGLGVSMVRREPALVSVNPWFSQNFAEYAATKYQSTLLTSGTLSITQDPVKGMQWIRNELGINKKGVLGDCAIHSPSHFGSMALSLAGPDFPSVYNRNVDDVGTKPTFNVEWLKSVASVIANTPGRVVVLTASHDESTRLTAELKRHDLHRGLIIHQAGQPIKVAVKAFQEEVGHRSSGILISAGGHVGLNIIGPDGKVGFDHLIVTRVVYAQPAYDEIEAMASFYLMTRGVDRRAELRRNAFMRCQNDAIRTMKQALGRGIRSPDDHINVIICDPRFPLSHDLSSNHAALRNIIPVRFAAEYKRAALLLPSGAGELIQPVQEIFF